MKILQTAKVTDKGRIPLGKEAMSSLGVGVGDELIIYLGDDGKVYIDRPVPASMIIEVRKRSPMIHPLSMVPIHAEP